MGGTKMDDIWQLTLLPSAPTEVFSRLMSEALLPNGQTSQVMYCKSLSDGPGGLVQAELILEDRILASAVLLRPTDIACALLVKRPSNMGFVHAQPED